MSFNRKHFVRISEKGGMGRRLRRMLKHAVFETVQGVVDRQFMFKPDHYPDIPTLSTQSSRNALDPDNDETPVPSTLNIVGAAIGRAIREVPVRLHCFEVNIDHKHSEESVDDGCCLGPGNCKWADTPRCGGVLTHPSRFHQRVNSVIAQQMKKKYEREGSFWAAPPRMTECIDDEQAEEKFFYALTNPVKDGQVDKVSESPFFSTYKYWVEDEPLRFWYIDWEAYDLAGGARKKSHRPKDYLHWVEWEPSKLPSWADKTDEQYATFIQENCRAEEEKYREERREENRPVRGVKKLYALDPRDRPKGPREKSPQPLCHASDPEQARKYKKGWRKFVDDHRKASSDYLNGQYYREFPEGSFRPPLITAYNASRL